MTLECSTSCQLPRAVWFKDGHPVAKPEFQAQAEDAGNYLCAVEGHESVLSDPVALGVQCKYVCYDVVGCFFMEYALTIYALAINGLDHPCMFSFKLVQKIHSISECIRQLSGCVFNTDPPLNVSVEVSHPGPLTVGGGVNLTCSSAANPAANYTWYKRTDSAGSTLQVGSGQVLSLPFMEASHTGLYLCQATNRLGGNNSTEVLLAMKREEHGLCHFIVTINYLK